MSFEIILFAALAVIIVASAVGMILTRNAVYSALLLVLNFATVALLYLALGAPFIALAQVTVYAGAIMVLFLFVIMLLGAERLPIGESLRGHRTVTILLGVVILAEAVAVIVWKGGSMELLTLPAESFATPEQVGLALFNQYALPFEITSVILLVAVVGAIVLTRGGHLDGVFTRPKKKE